MGSEGDGVVQSRSEDQLAAAQFRALLDSTSQGIIGVDGAGTIQLVNRKAEALFGYALGELLGQSIEVLVPDRVCNIHAEERKAYSECPRARPMGLGMELKGRRRDGSEFPVEISLNHVQAGDTAMTIGLVTDITERIEMEEHMRQAHKMEALGQLAGGVAHEFNNLLTVISGYSGMVLDGFRGDAEDRRSLEKISKAADRAADLTRQLLAFSRRQVVQPKWFNLNQRISQMQRLLCSLVGEKIELKLTLGENLEDMLADPAQVDDVIVNLVQNARDAMPDGGRLMIETAVIEVGEAFDQWHMPLSPGQHVMLTVIDTGVGMTPNVQARIFEPFFTTKAVGRGTGLGLAAVYGIVKDCGGSINVSSKLNQGTTFRLIFPRIWEVRDGHWKAATGT